MKKEKLNEVVIMIETLVRLLQKRGKNSCDYYECLSGISAELWWKSLRSIFEEDFKNLSANELNIIANLIFEKLFKEHEGYGQCLVVRMIRSEKITWQQIVQFYNQMGDGAWEFEVITESKISVIYNSFTSAKHSFIGRMIFGRCRGK